MVQKSISRLGPEEAEFPARVSESKGSQFDFEAALKFWHMRNLTYKKLTELIKRGWLARIERGKYLVIPLEAGPERKGSQDEYVVALSLVNPSAVSYWTAIHHWNWTEQILRVIYVQTTRRKKSKQREVFGITYEFVTVPPKKFFGHSKEWRDGKRVLVTNKEKTLIDCADDVERAGGVQELIKAIKEGAKEISWARLNEYATKFSNCAVKKRLGFLFEVFIPNLPKEAVSILESWHRSLSEGLTPPYPPLGRKGKISTRWRIIDNVGVR